MANLYSSELIRYNANTRGTNTGDCTARSISLAFNIDYRKARKALNESAKTNWNWEYNSHDNVVKVIQQLGGGNLYRQSDKITVNDWVDQHNSGTYIIWCSKDGTNHRNLHLVTVIDGTVYDSWDSRNYYVLGYWIITEGVKGEDITDIASALKDFFDSKDLRAYCEYAQNVFDRIIDKNRKLKKLSNEYDIDISISLTTNKLQWLNYTFKYFYTINISIPKFRIKDKEYKGKFAITFKPTMKESEIESYFDSTFYDKFYFFIHNVVDKIEDMCEGQKLLNGMQLSDKEYDAHSYFNLGQEKSFNALPYWVKKLTTYFSAESPFHNDYHDRVQLTIKMPPFDTEYESSGNNENRKFHAYNMVDLKAGLEYYKKTGDYEKAYEIAADY